jgi:hypothetical protein
MTPPSKITPFFEVLWPVFLAVGGVALVFALFR